VNTTLSLLTLKFILLLLISVKPVNKNNDVVLQITVTASSVIFYGVSLKALQHYDIETNCNK
jgi:hypothetical protein